MIQPELKKRKLNGITVWASDNKIVKTDRSETGLGRHVSKNKEGLLGEWIVYNGSGELLEGEVTEWK